MEETDGKKETQRKREREKIGKEEKDIQYIWIERERERGRDNLGNKSEIIVKNSLPMIGQCNKSC